MSTPDTTLDDAALGWDPFEGDYGDGETRIIDAIVDAPDPVRCHVCAGPIKPGTKVRRIVETRAGLDDMAAYEQARSEYLICETCCDAVRKDAADDDGDFLRLERRYAAGFRRREKKTEI